MPEPIDPGSGAPGTVEAVNRRAKSGIRIMLGRGVVLQVVTLVGGIILARILDPAEFGLFGIVTFVVHLLALWGDVGLAPSLIRRKEQFSEREMRTAFTVQQVLTVVGVAVLWGISPWVASFYPVDTEQLAWLIRVLAVNLFLQSFRAISAVVLERNMRYKPLAVVDMVENVFYQVVAVGMALAGFGIWSLIVAVLGRGVLGAGLMYSLSRWRIGFAFEWSTARGLLSYGLPFQAQRFVKQARDWLTPTLVAATIGPEAVGFLNWANKLGTKPSFVMTGNIARVSFTHFAKLQDNPEELSKLVRKYVQTLSPLYLLWLATLLVSADRLVSFVYTDKWLPAVPALLLYACMTYLSVFSWIGSIALNAKGDVMLVLKNSIRRTLMQLALAFVLVLKFGFIGIAIAQVVATAFLVTPLFRALQRGLLRDVLMSSRWAWSAFAASVALGWAARAIPGPVLVELALPILAAAAAYTLVSYRFGPEFVRTFLSAAPSRLIGALRGGGRAKP